MAPPIDPRVPDQIATRVGHFIIAMGRAESLIGRILIHGKFHSTGEMPKSLAEHKKGMPKKLHDLKNVYANWPPDQLVYVKAIIELASGLHDARNCVAHGYAIEEEAQTKHWNLKDLSHTDLATLDESIAQAERLFKLAYDLDRYQREPTDTGYDYPLPPLEM